MCSRGCMAITFLCTKWTEIEEGAGHLWTFLEDRQKLFILSSYPQRRKCNLPRLVQTGPWRLFCDQGMQSTFMSMHSPAFRSLWRRINLHGASVVWVPLCRCILCNLSGVFALALRSVLLLCQTWTENTRIII